MSEIREYGLWIGGKEFPAAAGGTFGVENPTTKQIIATVAEGLEQDVDHAVEVAEEASHSWGKTSPTERFQILCRLARLIRENAAELARWETLATGRPIREMAAQVTYIAEFYEYFAAAARTAEGEVTPFGGPYLNYVRHVPLGVVGLITPWNHPLLILTKKLAPALAAGNTVVIKPSEFTPTTTIDLARLCQQAGCRKAGRQSPQNPEGGFDRRDRNRQNCRLVGRRASGAGLDGVRRQGSDYRV
jgi:acyl-CoA reductase-like NAD-dependent aldehyde dehydrogenase